MQHTGTAVCTRVGGGLGGGLGGELSGGGESLPVRFLFLVYEFACVPLAKRALALALPQPSLNAPRTQVTEKKVSASV